MALVPTVKKPLVRLPGFVLSGIPSLFSSISSSLSQPQKIIIVSTSIGIALIGFVARYLRRRKRVPRKSALRKNDFIKNQRKSKHLIVHSPSSEYSNVTGSISPGFCRTVHRQRSLSFSSDRVSISSFGVAAHSDSAAIEKNTLTPQQYGVMGMEALEAALGFWEDALSSYTSVNASSSAAVTSQEEAEFTQCLQKIVDEAYTLQDRCEHLFLHQHSILFRPSSVTPAPSECHADHLERKTYSSISSADSFVSCQGDIADLRDLEDFEESNYPLYIAALKQHEDGGIPYRDIRTDWVRCSSDIEYICKVHCIRLACKYIFSQKNICDWFSNIGRQIIADLLVKADKDPKDALIAYDVMLKFLSTCDWSSVELELQARGIRAMTFYDVVLDFILMDAFDDLESPPSSVTAVVQNRWLSNGFKETALSTAVWSVLKAKRRMLKYQDGFIAHFYDLSEHLSPILAWGFLGPDPDLKEICIFFKDQILGLLEEMFSFNSARYTTVEELSEDVLYLAQARLNSIADRLAF